MQRNSAGLDLVADVGVVRVAPQALFDVVRETLATRSTIWIRVTGSSMNPIIRHGDSVLIGRSDRMPRKGEVVFLNANGKPLLHRVTRCRGNWVETRGDARRHADPRFAIEAILGRALAVRRGDVVVALAPTLRLGLTALLWYAAWWIRVRIRIRVRGTIGAPLSNEFPRNCR